MSFSIHWLCEHPTPYHHFLFQTIAEDPEINLTVHFRERALGSHPWQSDMTSGFKSRYFQRTLGLDWNLLKLAVREKSSFFIIAGWSKPAQIALISLLSAAHRRFALWTDTPTVGRPMSLFKVLFRRVWLQGAFRRASFVMGTGKPALAALSLMGSPKEKLVNFPTFIDLDFFSPRPGSGESHGGKLTFLSSGRLVNSLKAYDLALRALALARDRLNLSGNPFRYVLAGSGPDQERITALARELGLASQVELAGWLEPSQLANFYRRGQVLLHPSNHDNYPNAVMEAMACGLAVIGSDVTGVVLDRIRHGENGLIHRMGDVEDLTAQIVLALEHPEKVAAMGAQARITAEEWPASRAVSIVKGMLQSTQA